MITKFEHNNLNKISILTIRKIFILVAVCCVAVATPFSFTGISVGLSSISKDLKGTPIQLNWAINSFLLTFGSTLMTAGTLADNYGRKRLLIVGLIIFGTFSAGLSFLSINIFGFNILRAAQGIGAAAAFAGGFASLSQEYEGKLKFRAFSIVGASFGIGLAFGPIMAGWLITHFGWESIFSLVTFLSILALILSTLFMSESHDPAAAELDWKGAVSFTVALATFTFGIIQGPENGWGHPLVFILMMSSVVFFFIFIKVEQAVDRPMLDLSLFRYSRFLGAQLLAIAPSFAFVALLVLLPIRFIGIEGMDEMDAGKIMLALSAPFLILPIVAGLLTKWFTPSAICGVGFMVSAVGLYWLSEYPIGSNSGLLILPLLTIGIGISLPWGLMDGLAVSVVPKERAGMAIGIFSTSRVAGEGVVIALVTALLSSLTSLYISIEAGNQADAIAQLIVTGELREATLLMPTIKENILISGYDRGFTIVIWLLSAITALTSIIVFVFLGADRNQRENPNQNSIYHDRRAI